MVAAILLDVSLDDKVAKAKIKYYLGAFATYFLSIYMCMCLFSFSQYGKDTARKLYDASYHSKVYITATNNGNSNSSLILADLYKKNALVQSHMQLGDVLRILRHSSSKRVIDFNNSDEENRYSTGFREYVQQQRTILGCGPCIYSDGFVFSIPCITGQIRLPPGRIEDILLFICHNHPLLSCFYYMDGSKLGAHGTRIIYIGKDVVVFVLYQFSNMLLDYCMLGGKGLGTVVNLFIITPCAVSIGILLKNLYICPYLETVDFQRRYAKYKSLVVFLGRIVIILILFLMCGSLIIACLFSSGRRIPIIIINYFLYVQFYGILLALAKAMLLVVDNYYYQLSLFGVLDKVCIGRMFKERSILENLVVDIDYAYRINTYLFGLIKVEKILNRDDAIKAKWIMEHVDEGCGIEAVGAREIVDDCFIVQNNPLVKVLSHRNTASSFNMDTVYGANNDSCEQGLQTVSASKDNSDTVMFTTENPIHSSIGETITQTHQKYNNSQELSLRLQQAATNTALDDDDAALYMEYKSRYSHSADDTVYDMINDELDASITFEEWKIRRRQFKLGTRGSFVKAYQAFEEREQLALDKPNQSASCKNTIQLHTNSIKITNKLAVDSAGANSKRQL